MNDINIDFETINFEKMNGVISCVVQDFYSKEVLMIGVQTKEALKKSLETRKVTFFSRTKNQLWTKGETSGNFLEILNAKLDCDQDAILFFVNAPKATCHKETFTCFGNKTIDVNYLTKLAKTLKEKRNGGNPENSYVAKMFERGFDKIAQKVGEEAVEVVIASKNKDKKEFIYESADLVFHLLLLCEAKGVDFQEIMEELYARRKQNKK